MPERANRTNQRNRSDALPPQGQQEETRKESRIPIPDEDDQRPQDHQSQASRGPEGAGRLIRRAAAPASALVSQGPLQRTGVTSSDIAQTARRTINRSA